MKSNSQTCKKHGQRRIAGSGIVFNVTPSPQSNFWKLYFSPKIAFYKMRYDFLDLSITLIVLAVDVKSL